MSRWIRTIDGALINLAYIESVNSEPHFEEGLFSIHAWCHKEGGGYVYGYVLAERLSKAEAQAMLDKLLVELSGEVLYQAHEDRARDALKRSLQQLERDIESGKILPEEETEEDRKFEAALKELVRSDPDFFGYDRQEHIATLRRLLFKATVERHGLLEACKDLLGPAEEWADRLAETGNPEECRAVMDIVRAAQAAIDKARGEDN